MVFAAFLKYLCKVALALTVVGLGLLAQQAGADGSYGAGTYGACQYNTCGISLTSNGSVDVSVTPISGTKCTINSDSVAVLTDASTGYTLQLSDNDTSNQMSGAAHGQTIAAVSGSASTPATLAANTWGYRADGTGGFGSGPTSAQSSGAVPALAFAAPPLSSGSPDTIATSSSAADPAVTTTVWYGVCASASLASDTYSDSVTYTAVVN